jgi:hypothetical protein
MGKRISNSFVSFHVRSTDKDDHANRRWSKSGLESLFRNAPVSTRDHHVVYATSMRAF